MSLSYVERRTIKWIHRHRQSTLRRHFALMGETATKLVVAVQRVTSLPEFAPAALRVLSCLALGFWLVNVVKAYVS